MKESVAKIVQGINKMFRCVDCPLSYPQSSVNSQFTDWPSRLPAIWLYETRPLDTELNKNWRKVSGEIWRIFGLQVRVSKIQKKKGFSREEVHKVKEEGGKLSRGQLLRCRVRYFSEGVALGHQDFVEEVFQTNREHFGIRREKGAKPLRELDKKVALFSLRALRLNSVK